MLVVHKALLITALAVATAILLTPSAFAQTVEVVDEATAQHCADVTATDHVVSGGCIVQIADETTTTTDFYTHIPGIGEVVFSECTVALDVHVGEDGLGFIGDQAFGGEDCVLMPCDEAAPSHVNLEWPLTLMELGGGSEVLTHTFCVRNSESVEGEGLVRCTVHLTVTQTAHSQELSADQRPCHENLATEVSAHWETEAAPPDVVEIELAASGHAMEVLDGSTGLHCSTVQVSEHAVSGGCPFHVSTEPGTTADLYAHVVGTGEVLFSQCEHELEAHVDEAGFGYLSDQQLTGAGCGLAACDEAAPSHDRLEWPFVLFKGGPDTDALLATLCLRSAAAAEGEDYTFCSVALEASQTDHTQEFVADESSCTDSQVEVSGHWTTAPPPGGEIEVTHVH